MSAAGQLDLAVRVALMSLAAAVKSPEDWWLRGVCCWNYPALVWSN